MDLKQKFTIEYLKNIQCPDNYLYLLEEHVKDYIRFINEGYILVKDVEYFSNKYGITFSDSEKEVIKKIFGDWDKE